MYEFHNMSNNIYVQNNFTCLDVTMLVTCVGVGKYKTICKKGGNVVEMTTCFKDCGFTAVSISRFLIMQVQKLSILFDWTKLLISNL